MTNSMISDRRTVDIPVLDKTVELSELEDRTVRWIQSRLTVGGYLEANQVDGIPGPKTHKALAEFKADLWLEYPSLVGTSTISALAELGERQAVTEQPEGLNQKPLVESGRKEGRAVVLPLVGQVFQHEYIVPDVPLTWDEMTKGLDPRRIPNTVGRVQNIQRLAKVFGRVRSRFGSPIAVTSGYRPAELKIGVPNSQHIHGLAMDVYPLNRDFQKLLQIIKEEPAITGIGLGQRKGFLHIDIRPTSRVVFPY
ncbi:MAG: peptidase M15 [Leptolyngbya sp. DLM2.Bin27]|nr:MAG: peptidase M15 [Leptolyngbya sp. DLM2.Bin27]